MNTTLPPRNLSTQHAIIATARTWLGTPFRHQARVKSHGVDCLGFVVGVARELGLRDKQGIALASYDETTYGRTPNSAYLLRKLESMFDEVVIEDAGPGDLALFTVDDNPQHLGILTDLNGGLGLIHCDARSKRVVEHESDQSWLSKLMKVYRWHQ